MRGGYCSSQATPTTKAPAPAVPCRGRRNSLRALAKLCVSATERPVGWRLEADAFSCDIAYSDSPAASRASRGLAKCSMRTILASRMV